MWVTLWAANLGTENSVLSERIVWQPALSSKVLIRATGPIVQAMIIYSHIQQVLCAWNLPHSRLLYSTVNRQIKLVLS